ELEEAVRQGDAAEVQRLLTHASELRAHAPQAEAPAARGLGLSSPLPRSGLTALQLSCASGHARVCRLLLSRAGAAGGADPDAADARGRGPLHLAAAAGAAGCVAALMEYGADPCIAAGDDGRTPLELARGAGSAACVRALEDAVVLWQGWVDHCEHELLVFPTWKAKRLAVVRDRRPNSGPPDEASAPASWPCPGCGACEPMPWRVRRFYCTRCGTKIVVPAMLQMAIYETKSGLKSGRRGGVEMRGVLTQR
ncbi:unnamed protein product, partial [Prorocentrum cordatum]